jgi:hypothetical protein
VASRVRAPFACLALSASVAAGCGGDSGESTALEEHAAVGESEQELASNWQTGLGCTPLQLAKAVRGLGWTSRVCC